MPAMETAPGPTSRPNPPACGLYVHVPFCETKCGYCDFYSVAAAGRDTSALVDRLVRELDHRLGHGADNVVTVFVGGGTPTILPISELQRLLDAIHKVVDVPNLQEFTIEANPATVNSAMAALLVDAGVTRVSMGAQSFFEAELATLERIHTPNDIAPSVATLRRAGIGQINLDLIFGIPGQTIETWSQSLDKAIALEPDHIACYGLTYEPGTRLTAALDRNRIIPCDEQLESDMFLHTPEALAKVGYEPYEISNFAKPGCQCRHNLLYWRNEPYVGVGPSAAGCDGQHRYKNIPDVAGYIRMMDAKGHAEHETEPLTTEMLVTEMVMMQLRLYEGLSVSAFSERIGAAPCVVFGSSLERLTKLGLLTASDSHLALTNRGRLVANAVMAELTGAAADWCEALSAP